MTTRQGWHSEQADEYVEAAKAHIDFHPDQSLIYALLAVDQRLAELTNEIARGNDE